MYNIDKELINKVEIAWNDYLRRLEENKITDREWAEFKKEYSIFNPAKWYSNGTEFKKFFDFELIPEGWYPAGPRTRFKA